MSGGVQRSGWAIFFSVGVTAILLVTFLAVMQRPVQAATFTVTKTNDTADGVCDSDCSLREAIIAANANPGPDSITLSSFFYSLSIDGDNEDAAATGDLDILGDLTIESTRGSGSRINGNNLDRIFHILSGTVTMTNVIIQNGDAFDLGGGIRNAGTLILSNSTVELNSAHGGGGIYNSDRDYSIATSDQISGPIYSFTNISSTGVALNLSSNSSISRTIGFDFTFYGDSYDTIYISQFGYASFFNHTLAQAANVQLPQTEQKPVSAIFAFWDNLSLGSGNVYVETQGSAPNRQFIVQYDNVNVSVSGPITFQIVLYESSNEILLQYADVSTDSITQGGTATVGIQDKEERTSGIGYSFNQSVLADGLAIAFTPLTLATGHLTLDNVTVSNNNSVENDGGGLFNNGTAVVQNSSLIFNNTTQDDGEGNGAGLANRNGTLTIKDSTVYSNTNFSDGSGAGVSNWYGTTFVSNSTIEANLMSDDGSGAGVANGFGTMTIDNSRIIDNRSNLTRNTSGAGIFNLFGKVTINDSIISDNSLLEENSGGGIQSIQGEVIINSSTISGNRVGADSSGAGIDGIKSRIIIDGSTIADNINESLLEDDTNTDGGGVRINQGELIVTHSTISGNETGGGNGGGIAHISGGDRPTGFTVFDNRFYSDGPTYNFIDIAGSGTPLSLGDDDSAFVPIGFDFTYHDIITDMVYVSSNGYLTFEGDDLDIIDQDCLENRPFFGNEITKSGIMPLADNLDPSAGGQVYVETQGSAPNRQFIVQYDSIHVFTTTVTTTFQVILYEASDNILFQYADVAGLGVDGGLMSDIAVGLSSPQRGDADTFQTTVHYTTCGYEGIPLVAGLAILFEPAGKLVVANSTISGNSAGAKGGGIYHNGANIGGFARIINSTIAYNDAVNGGGINDIYGSLSLTNTIVTSNTTSTISSDCVGSVTSGGHNLDSDGSCNLVATGDIPNGNANLRPLSNGIGDTATHLLGRGSEAVNAGDNVTCAASPINNLDQRGVTRPQSFNCAIGAVENVVVIAVNDQYDATEDTTLVISATNGVLANDTLRLTSIAGLLGVPNRGTLTLNDDGAFTYTPDPGFVGSDIFTYFIDNGSGTDEWAVVRIDVGASTNLAPIAIDDVYTTNEDEPLVAMASGFSLWGVRTPINLTSFTVTTSTLLLDNDNDPDGDGLTAAQVSQPMSGTVVVNSEGAFIYLPDEGEWGTDSFTYRASDGSLATTATVTITIQPVAEAPALTIRRNGDSHLNWSVDSSNCFYEVHESDTPYFVPTGGTLQTTLPKGSSTISTTTSTGYFIVQAEGCAGDKAASNEVMAFSFVLKPGN